MKKILNILVVLLLGFGVTACSSKNDSDSNNSTNNNTTTTNTNNNQSSGDTDQDIYDYFHGATSSFTGAYATITVNPKLELKEDAWVGLCPSGKEYKTEIEADEVDVIFFYTETYVEGEDYVFACDFSSVEDGTYALIVATSDSDEQSSIVIQLDMTKSGESISFDYDSAVVNK